MSASHVVIELTDGRVVVAPITLVRFVFERMDNGPEQTPRYTEKSEAWIGTYLQGYVTEECAKRLTTQLCL